MSSRAIVRKNVNQIISICDSRCLSYEIALLCRMVRVVFQGIQFPRSLRSLWQKCRRIISRWRCAKSFAAYVPTVIAPDSIFDIRDFDYIDSVSTPWFIAGCDRFSYINIISPPYSPLAPAGYPRDYGSLISVLPEWIRMKMGYLLNQRYPNEMGMVSTTATLVNN